MIKYIIKRTLLMIPTMLLAIFLVFSIMELTPGTPGRSILGVTASQERVDQLDHELGYDRPFFVRFFSYCGGLLRGDLGKSYRTRLPFADELRGRLPTTAKVAGMSFVLSSLIGISLGILAAVRQYSFADVFSSVTAIFFASIPGFFLAMVLTWIFAMHLGWVPTFGITDPKGYILPVITLVTGGTVTVQRLTRTTMLEAIRQDYIRTARAKGCSERRITWKHAFKNGILPVLTVLGIEAGSLMGCTVICESVFSLPGMGTYILNAIRNYDIPVVMSSTVVLCIIFCGIMLLVDILTAVIDPRLRERVTA
ncbi:MAG: ABC transporter permease [Lachnospiraceae bacterium]|nr:ABC transporter permease [Lachnospiraceae bacterium]